MPDYLRITVRFLQDAYHGRADGGTPEWPPSPLRVFQALVAAGAARWNERGNLKTASAALEALERLATPLIVAARERKGVKYRLYVPDNVGDLVAKSWSRGNPGSTADYRTEKDVQPTHLVDLNAVHYLWPLGEGTEFVEHLKVIEAAAQSITHLGWGVDAVVGEAAVMEAAQLKGLDGQRWAPSGNGGGVGLRVPVAGTLDDLNRHYSAFLNRAQQESFAPVSPLSVFRIVGYRRESEAPDVPFAAFSLLKPDGSGFRPFDPVRNGMRVAGMLRHAMGGEGIAKAMGLSKAERDQMIMGHGEKGASDHVPVDGPRLAFVPIPSIESRGGGKAMVVGSVRRVLIFGVRGYPKDDLLRLARVAAGLGLVPEDSEERAEIAFLSRIPNSDKMIDRYTGEANQWATVTPVILPGYDDRGKMRRRLGRSGEGKEALDSEGQKKIVEKLDRRIDQLIRKAIRQGGFSEELARHAIIDWSGSGFWPGTELATRYAIPEKLRRFRRVHVRIQWRSAGGNELLVRGPICLGSGRFVGIGLFAPKE